MHEYVERNNMCNYNLSSSWIRRNMKLSLCNKVNPLHWLGVSNFCLCWLMNDIVSSIE